MSSNIGCKDGGQHANTENIYIVRKLQNTSIRCVARMMMSDTIICKMLNYFL